MILPKERSPFMSDHDSAGESDLMLGIKVVLFLFLVGLIYWGTYEFLKLCVTLLAGWAS